MDAYTTEQVAQELGRTASAVRKMAERHAQIGRKVGRDWVFTRADIERLRRLRPGPKRKRRAQPQPQPSPATQEEPPDAE